MSKKNTTNLNPTAESSMKKFKDMMTKLKEKRFGKEEGELNEALKPRDKAVIDAFYSRKGNLASNLLSVEGGKLTKMGMGGQEIAVWKNDKIVINAKMDVKSTEEIVRYMKKSIPSGVFEEVEIDESDGYEVDMAAKKIQHKWKKMSKSEKIKFLDKMDVLAGKTKVSDSDLEDILGDYGLYKEASGDKEAYQKFFNGALKKFGVKSPSQLKGDKKKEFFDYIDKNWTADHEEETKKEETMAKKSLKDVVSNMKEKKLKVQEAITIGGVEVGEQDFDKEQRLDHAAPNLGMTYKDYQSRFETNGLEGPYQIDGGAYFWDKAATKWFSVETEDYVDEKRNAELNFRYTKQGTAGGGLMHNRRL